VTELIVDAGDSVCTPVLDRWQQLSRPHKVIAQLRNEGHRDDARCDQRTGHDHRQTIEEGSGIAGQHQKREIRDDVGNGRE